MTIFTIFRNLSIRGLLISERAVAGRAAAHRWELSKRELAMVALLGQHGKTVYICPQTGQVDYDWQTRAEPKSIQVSRVDDNEVDATIIKKVVKEGR